MVTKSVDALHQVRKTSNFSFQGTGRKLRSRPASEL
jgi:hypothetical protein